MADVDDWLLSADGDDRGQLLLVGALTFAVMLVALAVLLNAAIYTGNVATRDAGPEAGAVIEYENEATSMAQSTIDALSERENMTEDELRQNFTRTVDEWSETARVHSGASLADAEVERVSVEVRTLIRQDGYRKFTGNGGEESWEVAQETTANQLLLNVSQDSLNETDSDSDAASDALNIVFEDNGNELIRIYSPEDSEEVRVSIGPADNPIGKCSAGSGSNGHVIVDITGGSVGDKPCPELDTLLNSLSNEYNLRIRNGHQAIGTYSMVVDKSVDNVSVTTNEDADGPYAKHVIYNAELELTYRTTDVYYQTEFEVTPGETDE